ncbi:MAG TPA: Rieske 2Fe-2S domain-containing protein [Marinobacter sp.]|nr:Rieske 2Fe-2S domain-containing protein [Marinobacter sp.]
MQTSEELHGHWQTVCSHSELIPGKFIEFQIEQASTADGSLPLTGFLFADGHQPKAYINKCPHMGIELNWMPGRFMDTDKLFIQCSSHGALFKPGTGECIAGPCQGDALSTLDVRVEGDTVQIRLPV